LIVTGLIILLAMVGAIVISLAPVQKTNDLTKGLSRQTFIKSDKPTNKNTFRLRPVGR
jgi:hypothetical protein